MRRYIDNNGGAAWIELCPIFQGITIPELFFLDMYNGQYNIMGFDGYLPVRFKADSIQETLGWSWKSEIVNGALHYSYNINGIVGFQSPDDSAGLDKAVRLGTVVKLRTLNKQTLIFGTHKQPLQIISVGDGGQKVSDLNCYKLEITGGGMFPPIYLPPA
jgi:hypothetical protein